MVVSDDQHADVEAGTRVVVYLDDDTQPLLTYEPPVQFDLDTSDLEDGRHRLRIEAYSETGEKGVRVIPFTVRNGPGIAISGLREDDNLNGTVPILINSYGGTGETQWEPSRAETPAPIPTWAWVLFITIVAFGLFYGIKMWKPPQAFADTPTYNTDVSAAIRAGGPGPERPESSAGAAGPGGGKGQAGGGETLLASEAAAQGAESSDNGQPAGAGNKNPAAGGGSDQKAGGRALLALGAKVYAGNCASCHQADGQGLPHVFPPLAGDPVVTADDPTQHIRIVLHGLQGKTIEGVSYASPMPAFGGRLSNREIAAVINHERTSWGNDAPTITPEDVAALR